MNRTAIINALITKVQAKKYLEIGISSGENFKQITCAYKVGVDPEPAAPATQHLTSDDFFKINSDTFDVIFIDGLHHADQVEKDILNALTVLNDGGYIVCHDMNPLKYEHQTIPFTGGHWNGDCWKAYVKLRQTRSDLSMHVVDVDEGCAVISKGSQELLVTDQELNFKNLDENRNSWLNLISMSEFYKKIDYSDIAILLNAFIQDPADAENNFSLALYYDNLGQSAAAISYYIRTAERTDSDLLKYECLIKSAMCFDKQGTRSFSVKGMLQHAVALLPKRPEAYFLLSRYHEREAKEGDWFLCYMLSSVGLEVCQFDNPPLRTAIDYPGKYGILFEKAVSSWWCGLCEESRELFKDLLKNYKLDDIHRKAVIANLQSYNELYTKELTLFEKSKYENLKVKFPGAETIERNYSESYQDMFILTMLNGKKNGTYLEIGGANPFYGNNTALLEKEFGWTGVSLDIEQQFVDAFAKERKNPCLLKDATTIDYNRFLSGLDFPQNIDYLQLDCDPPDVTYKILLSMPFEKYKFAVITYEHDYYCDTSKSFREKSRKYLESFGYVRVVGDIAPDEWRNYEDWWIHPDLINPSILQQMLDTTAETKKAEKYMFRSA